MVLLAVLEFENGSRDVSFVFVVLLICLWFTPFTLITGSWSVPLPAVSLDLFASNSLDFLSRSSHASIQQMFLKFKTTKEKLLPLEDE